MITAALLILRALTVGFIDERKRLKTANGNDR